MCLIVLFDSFPEKTTLPLAVEDTGVSPSLARRRAREGEAVSARERVVFSGRNLLKRRK
jgi:hypothetical protein